MDRIRFIKAGSLIDGSGGDVHRNVILTVTDGIISAIGVVTDLPSNEGVAIDDFSHCTIVPALVDCSVSLARSPSVDEKIRVSFAEADPAKKRALVAQHIGYCHAHGVLGVAESDDISDLPEHFQVEMGQGDLVDIRTAGRLFRSSQGWDTRTPGGGDFLRIAYSGNIDDEEDTHPRLNQEDLGRILQQRGTKRAVVVANGRQAVAEALAAGCDAIEQGYGMGEDNLRKMAAMEVLWIPSVLRAKNALGGARSGGDVGCRFSMGYRAPGKADPNAEIYWNKMLAEQVTQLGMARKLGVKTAVGTGAGSVGILHGESMVEEMKLFIKAGYSLAETIRSASEYGARFFCIDNLGALTVGRPATFLIARGGVQQLPRKLSYLEGIYVDGAPSNAYRKNPGIPA